MIYAFTRGEMKLDEYGLGFDSPLTFSHDDHRDK